MEFKITTGDGVEHTFDRPRPNHDDIQKFIDKSDETIKQLINEADKLNIDVLFTSATAQGEQIWSNAAFSGNAYVIVGELVDAIKTKVDEEKDNLSKYL